MARLVGPVLLWLVDAAVAAAFADGAFVVVAAEAGPEPAAGPEPRPPSTVPDGKPAFLEAVPGRKKTIIT